jgi:hypothetical protein
MDGKLTLCWQEADKVMVGRVVGHVANQVYVQCDDGSAVKSAHPFNHIISRQHWHNYDSVRLETDDVVVAYFPENKPRTHIYKAGNKAWSNVRLNEKYEIVPWACEEIKGQTAKDLDAWQRKTNSLKTYLDDPSKTISIKGHKREISMLNAPNLVFVQSTDGAHYVSCQSAVAPGEFVGYFGGEWSSTSGHPDNTHFVSYHHTKEGPKYLRFDKKCNVVSLITREIKRSSKTVKNVKLVIKTAGKHHVYVAIAIKEIKVGDQLRFANNYGITSGAKAAKAAKAVVTAAAAASAAAIAGGVPAAAAAAAGQAAGAAVLAEAADATESESEGEGGSGSEDKGEGGSGSEDD